jgi:hypothetical protein
MPSHDFIYNLSMRPAHGKVFMKIWLGFLSEYVMVCFFFDVQWIASYVICVCLRIVVSNTYCVVFLFCLSSSCVPYRCCLFLFIVLFWLPLRYSLTFICSGTQTLVNKMFRHRNAYVFVSLTSFIFDT